MWVFGYGSLMTDGWEASRGCTRRVVAKLHGYQRVFNKASVVNWGTHACPCPTLNLKADADTICIGIAFEFPEVRRSEIEAYLLKREGKDFMLLSLEIVMTGVGSVQALVPKYTGKNLVLMATTEELVASVRRARGTSGACLDYVIGVHDQLTKFRINDPAVTQLRTQLGQLI